MKISEIIDKVLSEEPQDSDISKKNLKIFYKTDIFIQGFPERRSGEEEEEEAKEESTIFEDIIKTASQGEISVPMNEVDNIQALEDLIDYVEDKKDGGKPILNDLVAEIVLSAADVGTKPLNDIVNKGDKVFVDIDYGKNRTDSVGIRVNKQSGSTALSISMKKDNKIIPGEFDMEQFNKQLVFYRNSLFGD